MIQLCKSCLSLAQMLFCNGTRSDWSQLVQERWVFSLYIFFSTACYPFRNASLHFSSLLISHSFWNWRVFFFSSKLVLDACVIRTEIKHSLKLPIYGISYFWQCGYKNICAVFLLERTAQNWVKPGRKWAAKQFLLWMERKNIRVGRFNFILKKKMHFNLLII